MTKTTMILRDRRRTPLSTISNTPTKLHNKLLAKNKHAAASPFNYSKKGAAPSLFMSEQRTMLHGMLILRKGIPDDSVPSLMSSVPPNTPVVPSKYIKVTATSSSRSSLSSSSSSSLSLRSLSVREDTRKNDGSGVNIIHREKLDTYRQTPKQFGSAKKGGRKSMDACGIHVGCNGGLKDDETFSMQ
jgi:hypothetical protein|tara:strand:- start:187 stop:747 length:561 start_codon:yes stop_codon:yes gene_type:complete